MQNDDMNTLQARLHSIKYLAQGIHGFEFRPADGAAWPVVSAGSHVDIHLATNLSRSYSLINAPGESHRYVIAVNRDEKGKGGSRYMHDTLRVGQCLSISEPRNSFPLQESASQSIFIAGGIGITPLWCMIQRLAQLDAPWTLHYAARTRGGAALIDQLEALALQHGGVVKLYFDQGESSKMMDLPAIIQDSPPDAHLYCCGPARMLEAFDQAAAASQHSPERVHREYFAAPPLPSETGGTTDESFCVRLSKSGKVITVDKGTTILDAILDAGVDVPYSCMSGICGACAINVLDGIPDHRDLVLSDTEKESGKTVVICCSRSKSPELVLEI